MSDPPILGSYWTLAGDTNPGSSNPGAEWSPWDVRDRISTAGAVGFAGMGFWHADLAHIRGAYTFEHVSDALDASGIGYVELEFLEYGRLDDPEYTERHDMLLEAAAALDADHLKIGNLADATMPIPQIREAVARFAARAADADTAVGLEFVTGDDNITTLEEAASVVAGIENAGVILDTWHLVKRGIPFERMQAIPIEDLTSVELNDGGFGLDVDRGTETTNYRALPGDGDFDVAAFVRVLKDMGYAGPWGVEVLSKELRELPMAEAYDRVYEATRRVVQEA